MDSGQQYPNGMTPRARHSVPMLHYPATSPQASAIRLQFPQPGFIPPSITPSLPISSVQGGVAIFHPTFTTPSPQQSNTAMPHISPHTPLFANPGATYTHPSALHLGSPGISFQPDQLMNTLAEPSQVESWPMLHMKSHPPLVESPLMVHIPSRPPQVESPVMPHIPPFQFPRADSPDVTTKPSGLHVYNLDQQSTAQYMDENRSQSPAGDASDLETCIRIYRVFASLFKFYGPMEATDERLLNRFMQLKNMDRKFISKSGGLQKFLTSSEYFINDGDEVRLIQNPPENILADISDTKSENDAGSLYAESLDDLDICDTFIPDSSNWPPEQDRFSSASWSHVSESRSESLTNFSKHNTSAVKSSSEKDLFRELAQQHGIKIMSRKSVAEKSLDSDVFMDCTDDCLSPQEASPVPACNNSIGQTCEQTFESNGELNKSVGAGDMSQSLLNASISSDSRDVSLLGDLKKLVQDVFSNMMKDQMKQLRLDREHENSAAATPSTGSPFSYACDSNDSSVNGNYSQQLELSESNVKSVNPDAAVFVPRIRHISATLNPDSEIFVPHGEKKKSDCDNTHTRPIPPIDSSNNKDINDRRTSDSEVQTENLNPPLLISAESQTVIVELVSTDAQTINHALVSAQSQNLNNVLVSAQSQTLANELVSVESQTGNCSLVTTESQTCDIVSLKSVISQTEQDINIMSTESQTEILDNIPCALVSVESQTQALIQSSNAESQTVIETVNTGVVTDPTTTESCDMECQTVTPEKRLCNIECQTETLTEVMRCDIDTGIDSETQTEAMAEHSDISTRTEDGKDEDTASVTSTSSQEMHKLLKSVDIQTDLSSDQTSCIIGLDTTNDHLTSHIQCSHSHALPNALVNSINMLDRSSQTDDEIVECGINKSEINSTCETCAAKMSTLLDTSSQAMDSGPDEDVSQSIVRNIETVESQTRTAKQRDTSYICGKCLSETSKDGQVLSGAKLNSKLYRSKLQARKVVNIKTQTNRVTMASISVNTLRIRTTEKSVLCNLRCDGDRSGDHAEHPAAPRPDVMDQMCQTEEVSHLDASTLTLCDVVSHQDASTLTSDDVELSAMKQRAERSEMIVLRLQGVVNDLLEQGKGFSNLSISFVRLLQDCNGPMGEEKYGVLHESLTQEITVLTNLQHSIQKISSTVDEKGDHDSVICDDSVKPSDIISDGCVNDDSTIQSTKEENNKNKDIKTSLLVPPVEDGDCVTSKSATPGDSAIVLSEDAISMSNSGSSQYLECVDGSPAKGAGDTSSDISSGRHSLGSDCSNEFPSNNTAYGETRNSDKQIVNNANVNLATSKNETEQVHEEICDIAENSTVVERLSDLELSTESRESSTVFGNNGVAGDISASAREVDDKVAPCESLNASPAVIDSRESSPEDVDSLEDVVGSSDNVSLSTKDVADSWEDLADETTANTVTSVFVAKLRKGENVSSESVNVVKRRHRMVLLQNSDEENWEDATDSSQDTTRDSMSVNSEQAAVEEHKSSVKNLSTHNAVVDGKHSSSSENLSSQSENIPYRRHRMVLLQDSDDEADENLDECDVISDDDLQLVQPDIKEKATGVINAKVSTLPNSTINNKKQSARKLAESNEFATDNTHDDIQPPRPAKKKLKTDLGLNSLESDDSSGGNESELEEIYRKMRFTAQPSCSVINSAELEQLFDKDVPVKKLSSNKSLEDWDVQPEIDKAAQPLKASDKVCQVTQTNLSEPSQQSQIIYTTATEIANTQNASVLVSSQHLPVSRTMLSSSQQQQQQQQQQAAEIPAATVASPNFQQPYSQMRQQPLGQHVMYPYPGPPSQMPRYPAQAQPQQVYQFGQQPLMNPMYNIVPQTQIPPPQVPYSQYGNTNRPLQPGQQILASLHQNQQPHQQSFQYSGAPVQQRFHLGTSQAPMPLLPQASQQSVITVPMANVHSYMSQGNVIQQQQQLQQQQLQQQQIYTGQGLLMRGNNYQPVQQGAAMHPTIVHQAANIQVASILQQGANIQAASALLQGSNMQAASALQPSLDMQTPSVLQPGSNMQSPSGLQISTNMQAPSVLQPSSNIQAPSGLQTSTNMQTFSVLQPSFNMQAPSELQTSTNMHAPSALQTSINMQAPSGLQTSINMQAPSGLQTSTNMQTFSVLQPSSNMQAPSGLQTSINMQAPSGIQTSTNMQAPSGLQTSTNMQAPSGLQTSANMQAPSGLQTSANMQAPSGLQTSINMQAPSALQTRVPMLTIRGAGVAQVSPQDETISKSISITTPILATKEQPNTTPQSSVEQSPVGSAQPGSTLVTNSSPACNSAPKPGQAGFYEYLTQEVRTRILSARPEYFTSPDALNAIVEQQTKLLMQFYNEGDQAAAGSTEQASKQQPATRAAAMAKDTGQDQGPSCQTSVASDTNTTKLTTSHNDVSLRPQQANTGQCPSSKAGPANNTSSRKEERAKLPGSEDKEQGQRDASSLSDLTKIQQTNTVNDPRAAVLGTLNSAQVTSVPQRNSQSLEMNLNQREIGGIVNGSTSAKVNTSDSGLKLAPVVVPPGFSTNAFSSSDDRDHSTASSKAGPPKTTSLKAGSSEQLKPKSRNASPVKSSNNSQIKSNSKIKRTGVDPKNSAPAVECIASTKTLQSEVQSANASTATSIFPAVNQTSATDTELPSSNRTLLYSEMSSKKCTSIEVRSGKDTKIDLTTVKKPVHSLQTTSPSANKNDSSANKIELPKPDNVSSSHSLTNISKYIMKAPKVPSVVTRSKAIISGSQPNLDRNLREKQAISAPPLPYSTENWDEETVEYDRPFVINAKSTRDLAFTPNDLEISDRTSKSNTDGSGPNPASADWKMVSSKRKRELSGTSHVLPSKPAPQPFLPKPASPRCQKQNNFERLISKMMEIYPFITRAQAISTISEIREQRGNLTGLTLDAIITAGGGIIMRRIQSMHKTPESDEDQCVICFEPLKDAMTRTLDCNHTFHKDCIRQWVRHDRTCPNCRQLALFTDEYPKLGSR